MRCIVIDDEPLAREGISDYIQELDYLELVGSVENPIQAINLMATEVVDLLFVDIQTPKMTGIEFIKTLANPPMIIITTAYPSYALDGYELNVIDYLVKPITFNRFLKAAEKSKKMYDFYHQVSIERKDSSHFFVKVENKLIKLDFDNIDYIESMQNYVRIYCGDKNYVTLQTLKGILEELPSKQFYQVHKSYIVNLDKISSIEGNAIRINRQLIPISRSLKSDFIKEINSGM